MLRVAPGWRGISLRCLTEDRELDPTRFDDLGRSLANSSRRSLLGFLAVLPAAGAALVIEDAAARRQRGRVGAEHWRKRISTYCLNGETIRRYRRKQATLLAAGATLGRCQPQTCAATCTSGCCAGETCQPGSSSQACGSGGGACATCSAEQVCRDQACGPLCLPLGATCNPSGENACCSGVCCGNQGNPVCCQPT